MGVCRLVRGSKYVFAARQMPKKSSIVISSSSVNNLTGNYPEMNSPAFTGTEKNCHCSHHDMYEGA